MSTARWKGAVGSQRRPRSFPFCKMQRARPLDSPFHGEKAGEEQENHVAQLRNAVFFSMWLKANYLVTWWLFSPSVEENNIECSLCPHSITKNPFKRCIFECGSTIRSFLLPRPSCRAKPLEESGVLSPALANLHYGFINFYFQNATGKGTAEMESHFYSAEMRPRKQIWIRTYKALSLDLS